MSKLKEIINEKSTWTLGIPSLVVGVMTLLKADHAQEVATTISSVGEHFINTGDWKTAGGYLLAGVLGVFMKWR